MKKGCVEMLFLSDEQLAFKKELRDFTDAEIRPAAGELEKDGAFPRTLYTRLGSLGYLDANFALGRAGAKHNVVDGVIIIEEISRGLASLGLNISPHVQCCDLVATAGSEALRREVLQPALRGEKLFAFALSEESGGSDALGIDTMAVRSGDNWIINGKKCWITNAGMADGYIVGAKSPASGRSRSVSLFYVDKSAPGFSVCESDRMIGMHNSPTGSVLFDDCVIPADYLIGPENDAYPLIKTLLNVGRLNMAAVALGIAQAAMEASIAYTSTIGRYGRSLSSYQAIAFMVADMYTKITTARNSLYHVASLFEAGKPVTTEVAALKLYATEMCCEVCKSARQVHGANGLKAGSEVERCFRDAQLLTIAEGSSEICRIVVSNALYRSKPGEY